MHILRSIYTVRWAHLYSWLWGAQDLVNEVIIDNSLDLQTTRSHESLQHLLLFMGATAR
jgi:hypothetical protein